MKGLRDWLAKNPSLEELDLSNNHLDEGGVICLRDGLRFNTNLKVLDLSYNYHNILKILSSHMTGGPLRKFILKGFGIDTICLSSCLKDLFTCGNYTRLTEIVLSHNNISDEGVNVLCEALTRFPNNLSINLSCNPITAEGKRTLMDFQTKSPRFEFIL